jgi:dihydrolipoamide dehydrogenase
MIRLAIIGGGPGGYAAALRAARSGAQVTLVSDEPLGGTCLWRGCIPTKTLRASAHVLDLARRGEEFGLQIEGSFQADPAGLRRRTDQVIDVQAKGLAQLFKQNKIEVIVGRARLNGPGRISVTTAEGAELSVSYDRLIIATGARAASVPGLDIDGRNVWSSDHALALTEIPRRLLVVGAGAVGAELAVIYRLLGAEVTLVEFLDRLLPLPGVDEDISKLLLREMKKRRIKVFCNERVDGVESNGPDGLTVSLEPAPGASPAVKAAEVSVDRVLVAAGRQPNTNGLDLETVGLTTTEAGWIQVNDRLETAVSGIYAVGDVLGPARPMLAHAASAEGELAADHACGLAPPAGLDQRQIPYAVFTLPEAAGVGLTETQARQKDLDVKTATFHLRSLGRAQAEGEIAGLVKLIARTDSGQIVGGHICGAGAAEMIHQVAAAIESGATAADLAALIHAHPTMSEGLGECARLLIQFI